MGRGRFVNAHAKNLRRSLWNVFLWKIGHYDNGKGSLSPPSDFVYPAASKHFTENLPSAVWVGHSTYLLEVDGLSILTDPVWDPYCAPVPIRGLRRYSDPSVQLADLPPIDIVLISHNHYDHLDSKTVMTLHRFHPQIQWIVPEKLSSWFRKRGIEAVTELPRWNRVAMGKSQITAVPAQHFSGRTLCDLNKTHWNGYVIQTPSRSIYFVGDTGYNPFDFKEIGRRFGGFDLSLIPIGTYLPNEFMSPVHICPREAVQIHQEVFSKLSLGMHWNTFRLSDEPPDRPPYDLYLAMNEKRLALETFLPVDIGTYVNF